MTRTSAFQRTFACLQSGDIAEADALIEARLLVFHALNITPEEFRMRPDTPVTAGEQNRLDTLAERRAKREPLAYILGERYFYGLRFEVTPAVLIPRPETELLVEIALERLANSPMKRVADVGTGSGCIAVAVAAHCREATVFATDISSEALAIATRNAALNGAQDQIRFLPGDLLTPAAGHAPFGVIVSNPPYIAPAEIETLQPEVRDWEPRLALGEYADSLLFYRRLAQEAPPLLAPGGVLAVEVGQGQAEAVMALWHSAGLVSVSAAPDYAGIPRMVEGTAT